MPNPDVILEAQFPIHHNATTVIQLLTYESSTLEAVPLQQDFPSQPASPT